MYSCTLYILTYVIMYIIHVAMYTCTVCIIHVKMDILYMHVHKLTLLHNCWHSLHSKELVFISEHLRYLFDLVQEDFDFHSMHSAMNTI